MTTLNNVQQKNKQQSVLKYQYAPIEFTPLIIKDISLLSMHDIKKCRYRIKPIKDEWWWIRVPYNPNRGVVYCKGDTSKFMCGDYVKKHETIAVRPVLYIESDNMQIGDRFLFRQHHWTVILNGIALSDEAFCHMAFRKEKNAVDADDYEYSDIKKYLNDWLKAIEK